jgi:hypothetical protein
MSESSSTAPESLCWRAAVRYSIVHSAPVAGDPQAPTVHTAHDGDHAERHCGDRTTGGEADATQRARGSLLPFVHSCLPRGCQCRSFFCSSIVVSGRRCIAIDGTAVPTEHGSRCRPAVHSEAWLPPSSSPAGRMPAACPTLCKEEQAVAQRTNSMHRGPSMSRARQLALIGAPRGEDVDDEQNDTDT